MKRQKIPQLLNLGTLRRNSGGQRTYKFVFVLLALACLQFAVFSSTQAQTETREKILIVTTDEINGVGIPSSANKQLGDQYNKTIVDEFEQNAGNAEIRTEAVLNDGQAPPADFYKGYDIVIINSVFATIDKADRDAIQAAILNKDSNVFVLFIDSCAACSAENRSWLLELVNANATSFKAKIGPNRDGFTSFPLNTNSPYADSFTGLNPMYGGFYTPFQDVPVDFILYRKDNDNTPLPTPSPTPLPAGEGPKGEAMAVLLPLDEAKGSCMFATYDGTMFHDDPNAYTKNQDRIAPAFLAAARGGSCFAKVQQADLSITIDATETVDEGGTVDYTITVQNNGPDAAKDTKVIVELPAGLTLAAKPNNCSGPENGNLTCSVGEIASSGSQEIKLSGTADTGTGGQAFLAKASISSNTDDPAKGNNSAEDDTLVKLAADPGNESICTCGSQTAADSSTNTQDGVFAGFAPISIYSLDNGSVEDSVSDPALVTAAGTIHGDPTPTEDRFGNPAGALLFDGESDYIETNEESNFKPLTFSVWFRADDVSGEHSIVDSDVGGKYGHSLIIGYEGGSSSPSKKGDGTLDVQFHNGFWDTGYKIEEGIWYQVFVTYGDEMRVYVRADGETELKLVDRQPYQETQFDGSKFRFGRHNEKDPQWFKGAMDDIRFYKAELTEQEVNIVANCTCPPSEPPALPTQPIPACSWGDVHIKTPDAATYHFQQVGDFILTKSDNVMLQARQEWWVANPVVSINTAVALDVAGDRLELYVNPDIKFYINGELKDLPAEQISLPHGGIINPVGAKYTIVWPDGNTAAQVNVMPWTNGHYLDIGVAKLGGSQSYEGICGNFDGDQTNDLQVRNGQALWPTSDSNIKTFGDSWRAGSESLFMSQPAASSIDTDASLAQTEAAVQFVSYRANSTSQQDDDTTLTLMDFDPAVLAEARQTCQDGGISDPLALHTCTYDVAATGDDSFVSSGQDLQEATKDNPEFFPAVPEQGFPVPLPTGIVLEIGQQYAVQEGDSGNFNYLQLTGMPTETESRATFSFCPDLQSTGLVVVEDIMTVDQALEQGLTAKNEPCTETSAVTVSPEGGESPVTSDEPANQPEETSDEGGPLSGICASATILPLALGMVGGWGAWNGRRRKKRNG